MLGTIAIGLGVIFAVKNINVTIESYSYASGSTYAGDDLEYYEDAFQTAYKGKLMSAVSEEDVEQYLLDDDSSYVLDSFEKVLPCTINITLRERRETYLYANANGTYNVYDSTGRLLRVAADEDEAMNVSGVGDNENKSPNVILNIQSEDLVSVAAELGDVFQEFFADKYEDGSISPIRSTVESITIEERTSSLQGYNVIFKLRCGLSVEIYDYVDALETKMGVAYEKFTSLSAEQKLHGYIYCKYSTTSDKYIASYKYSETSADE